MQEIYQLLIGLLVLVLGYPLGIFLASHTKEELKSGQKWFKLIVFGSLIGGLIGLVLKNDVLMFSFFFMAIVASQSLNRSKR